MAVIKLQMMGLVHLKELNNLTYLDLSYCSELTDDGLVHLKGLTNLTYLGLSECENITIDGVENLTNNNHKLSIEY
jgi:hypothetical protein